MEAGADRLVISRPLFQAKMSLRDAALRSLDEIDKALPVAA